MSAEDITNLQSKQEKMIDEREKAAILQSLGPLKQFFEQKDLTDIWVDHGNVSVKEFGRQRHDTGIFISNQQARNIIVQIAKYQGITIDRLNNPKLESTIPHYEARISAVLEKWCRSPIIIIRKRPETVFSLDDYVKNGTCSQEVADKIKHYIKFRKNIIIAGATGTGKTTLANAILLEMATQTPNDSFYIVEDTPELQCLAKYAEMLVVDKDPQNAIDFALRASPDRIIFGEVRTGKVLKALLDGWNTGHPGGVCTLHSNTAASAILRMREKLYEDFGRVGPFKHLVDLIIHLAKVPGGIIIDELLETKNYTEDEFQKLADKAQEEQSSKGA